MDSTLSASSTTASRKSTYELLLHAINHEQTKENYERHVLVLEKWCRESTGGLYISDLKYVVEVLQIMQERLLVHPTMFTPVLSKILKNCCQPLLESKANERMRPTGLENIKALYFELSNVWENGTMFIRTECARCFRVIVNGGRDPDILKADYIEWKSDGLTAQVTDISFIQSLIRESGALEAIVREFHRAADQLTENKTDFFKASATLSKIQTRKNISQDDDSDDEMPSTADDAEDMENNNKMSTFQQSHGSGSYENDLVTQVDIRRGDLSILQELTDVLLDLALRLSADAKNASSMCSLLLCDGATKLLQAAADESPRDSRVGTCLEVLWNCLESYLQQTNTLYNTPLAVLTSVDVMDFSFAIITLKRVFLELLMEGYRLADKEVRNEVVIVLTLIANFPSAIPYFLQSGLLLDLLTYSCAGEAGKEAWQFFSTPIAKFRNFSSAFDVDIQFKKEMWMLLSDILKFDDPDIILCVASSPLLNVMLNYLEQNTLALQTTTTATGTASNENSSLGNSEFSQGRSSVRGGGGGHMGPASEYSRNQQSGNGNGNGNGDKDDLSSTQSQVSAPTQLRELQVLAIIFLSENAHRLMGEFMRIEGPVKILDVITRYGSASSITEYKSLIFHSLLLLNRCLMNSNVVKERLEDQQAIQVFLVQFEESDDESIRAQAARLISIMCTSSAESQLQLRKLQGINTLIKTLSNYADSRRPMMSKQTTNIKDMGSDTTSQVGSELSVLVVAVLDCLWNGVVGNRKNEARFAQVEGIDALLDVIEVAPLLIRVQALRLFGDLLNNHRLVTFALAWRSAKTMRSVGQLLAHAWMEEETRLGYERSNGVICNLWDPLDSHRWPTDRPTPTATPVPVNDPVHRSNGSMSSASSNVSSTLIQSAVVSKLTNAISSTRNVGGTQSEVHANLLKLDVRGIVANALALLGLLDDYTDSATVSAPRSILEPQDLLEEEVERDFVSATTSDTTIPVPKKDDSLAPTDLQVVSMAARYGILREGQWWRAIVEEMQNENIIPVEADGHLISEKLEKLFDAARSVQFEQMELVAVARRMKQSEENVFIGHIIQQKNQEIKSEWLKRKALTSKIHVPTKVKL
eukprot:gene888-1723_t